jgi:hypothetical protein
MIWHFFVWSYLTDNSLLNNKDLELFLKNFSIQGSDTPYFVLLLSLFLAHLILEWTSVWYLSVHLM